MTRLSYQRVQTGLVADDYPPAAEAMMGFILLNLASSQRVITGASGRQSLPGCIIASPCYPVRPGDGPAGRQEQAAITDQDYVFHWVRDAAIAAIELAHWAHTPQGALDDYVDFCRRLQAGPASIGFACFRVDGTPRDGSDPGEHEWSEQSDGPAFRILSLIEAWPRLGARARAAAREIMRADLAYLLAAFLSPTTGLWEESIGLSFFTRAAHLRAFRALRGFGDPEFSASLDALALEAAIEELQARLLDHWNPSTGRYEAMLEATDPRGAALDVSTVMAAVYGAAAVGDPRMLASFAQLWDWAVQAFPINAQDWLMGLGPMLGRYPGDAYDGDMASPGAAQPWALCTCNGAEYLYALALDVRGEGLSADPLSARFREIFQILPTEGPHLIAARLQKAGDRLLGAVLHHAAHRHLSEQFDAVTGFEKSVQDLSWSHAAYVSAVRMRRRLLGQ